ncbi:MAG TPA: porin family protein, partial [Chitinophagaceae bacterium]
ALGLRNKPVSMKKIALTALVSACFMFFTEAGAQPPAFGIRAGANFSTLTGKDNNGYEFTNRMKTGIHAGVNLSIPVAQDFVVRPELLYSEKGAESPAGNQYKLSYVEVPVNLIYKPVLGKGRLMLGFGPYMAFGVGGKVTFTNGEIHDVAFRSNVTEPEARTAYYRSTDAGLNVLGGYDFGRLSVQLNGQLGMTNIYPEFNGVEPTARLKNQGFGVSLGLKL